MEEQAFIIRRTTSSDLTSIGSLVQEDRTGLERRYGKFDIEWLFEKSYVAITVTDSKGAIVGFCTFCDSPHLREVVPSATWEGWLKDNFLASEVQVHSSVWLTLLACEPLYAQQICLQVLDTIFSSLPEVERVLFTCPSDATLSPPLDQFFEELAEKPAAPQKRSDMPMSVFECQRERFLPPVTVRVAQVEDYDVLRPLLESELDGLRGQFGEYYLADLLGKQSSTNRVLIAEADGDAVGIMCLSTDGVDMSQLSLYAHTDELDDFARVGDGSVFGGETTMSGGASNVVQITLFFMKSPHESMGPAFLPMVFQLFPRVEYCVITLPHALPDMDLLHSFTRLRPKQPTVGGQTVHAVSRYSLAKQTSVSVNSTVDRELIRSMALDAEAPAQVMDDLRAIASDSKLGHVVSLKFGGQLVGFAVLLSDVDTAALRSSYELRQLIATSVGYDQSIVSSLRHLYVRSPFANLTKLYIREMMRVTNRSSLFYQPPPPTVGVDAPLPNFVQCELIPVRPRRSATSVAPLHFISRRLLSEPKQTVHARAVVVGASDAGLSFLYNLATVPYLDFPNLVLVSPEGLPPCPSSDAVGSIFPSKSALSPSEYGYLAPRVCVVQSAMESLDRPQKVINLENGEQLPYDYLFLTTGLQHKAPQQAVPDGFLTLSSSSAFQDNLRETLDRRPDGDILIYGNTLDCYGVIPVLMSLGVKPARITLSRPPESPTPFFDERIQSQVDILLHSMEVTLLRDATLTDVDSGDNGWVSAAHLEVSKNGEVQKRQLDISLIVNGDDLIVDPRVLHSVHSQCLVFDGRIVVDANFRTIDPCIYASSGCAKFSRRLGPSTAFDKLNPRELGDQMATSFVAQLDPETASTHNGGGSSLPLFRMPLVWQLALPDESIFFASVLPQAFSQQAKVQEVLTDLNDNYLRMEVSANGRVVSLSYFGYSKFDFSSWSRVVGLHERLLGGLMATYESGAIEDLTQYLSQPWVRVVTHDHFAEFKAGLVRDIAQKDEILQLTEIARAKLATGSKPSVLSRTLVPSDVLSDVDPRVVQFLTESKQELAGCVNI